MSMAEDGIHPCDYLASYRAHVLEPIATGVNRVEREQAELERERDAYRAFAARVDTLSTASAPVAAGPNTASLTHTATDHTDELRTAYEETVMDVAHFEDVYGESVGDNLVAEFGPELASLFAPSAGVGLTADHKQALAEAAHEKARKREQLGETLAAEHDSLLGAYEALETLLAECDSNVVPAWYRDQFDERVQELIETRQAHLGRQAASTRRDGHELCEYLYAELWFTYPVLTALGRLREATVIRE